MTRAAFALLLGACGSFQLPADDPSRPNLTPIAGQAEFARVAWEALGQTGAPPPIEWRRVLDCPGGRLFLNPATGNCVDGTYQRDAAHVIVALLPGSKPHEMAVAHEYQHFIDWRDLGVSDTEHMGAAFQEGGAVHVAEMAMMIGGY